MKSNIAKAAVAAAIGLVTAISAAYGAPGDTRTAGTTTPGFKNTIMDMGQTSVDMAKDTWRFTGRVGRTVVDSPVIAYQVVRGERPLFPHEMASRNTGRHEQVALTGHRTPRHYDPPI
jgi:hypothetical protein